MDRVLCVAIGYLIGCFQTAFILGKYKERIDIRNYGSGNSGTTNVIRTMGWKAGVITFLADFLKAVLAVLLCKALFNSNILGFYAGLGVVIGHNWPVFLNFKGGKGIASTLGLLVATDWRVGLIAIGIMGIVIGISRFVSLGSILMVISVPISMYFMHTNEIEYLIVGLILMGSALYQHRENIKRLLSGSENKLGKKKRKAKV